MDIRTNEERVDQDSVEEEIRYINMDMRTDEERVLEVKVKEIEETNEIIQALKMNGAEQELSMVKRIVGTIDFRKTPKQTMKKIINFRESYAHDEPAGEHRIRSYLESTFNLTIDLNNEKQRSQLLAQVLLCYLVKHDMCKPTDFDIIWAIWKPMVRRPDEILDALYLLMGDKTIFDEVLFYTNSFELTLRLINRHYFSSCERNGADLSEWGQLFINLFLALNKHRNKNEMHVFLMHTRYNDEKTLMFVMDRSEIQYCLQLYRNNFSNLYQLLSICDGINQTALNSNTIAIADLLQKTFTAEHWLKLHKLLSITGSEGKTIMFSNQCVKHLLPLLIQVYTEHTAELYELLSIQKTSGHKPGRTVLSFNPIEITTLLQETFTAEHWLNLHKLLIITRNDNGKTIMFSKRCIKHILPLLKQVYTEHPDELYELLSFQKTSGYRSGRTALWFNPIAIIDLVRNIFTTGHWMKLHKLLSITDDEGKTIMFSNQCVELLLPLLIQVYAEHTAELYELLSIQTTLINGTGRTALGCNPIPIIDLLQKTFTGEHWLNLHKLFIITRNDNGETIMFVNRCIEHFLRLLNQVYTGHTDKLYELLSIQKTGGYKPGRTVLWFNPIEITNLLQKTFTGEHWMKLHKLLSITDDEGKTIMFSNRCVEHLLPLLKKVYTEHTAELYELISIQEQYTSISQTALYYNPMVVDLLESTFSPDCLPKLHQALTATDVNSETALFNKTCRGRLIPFLTKAYKGHAGDLYELLSIQTRSLKRTVIHEDLSLISSIILENHSTQYSAELNRLLLIRDSYNKTGFDLLHNQQDWLATDFLLELANNQCYYLCNQPTALVVYTSKSGLEDRENSDEEAESIISVLKSLQYDVSIVKDELKTQILDAVEMTAASVSDQSAYIVVVMSHGSEVSFGDYAGDEIEFVEIETAMCKSASIQYQPKIMITQCCRGGVGGRTSDAAQDSRSTCDPGGSINYNAHRPPRPAYEPTRPHFCAIMSTTSGRPSERNVFIPRLAEKIENCQTFDQLPVLATSVSAQMEKEGWQQTPIVQNTLKYQFCPAVYKTFRSVTLKKSSIVEKPTLRPKQEHIKSQTQKRNAGLWEEEAEHYWNSNQVDIQ